mmetsp:Transcript_104776/g.337799  ORF Transcript_104776/g.337799 Transcript_104776/m.337799 type:complete len:171 (-) Transcript_104776:168-680(-)
MAAAAASAAASAPAPPLAVAQSLIAPQQPSPVEQAFQIEKLQKILEYQQQLFTKTLKDMEAQVYEALLNKDGNVAHTLQRGTGPSTPASTDSGWSRSTAMRQKHPRENTLQTWNDLGVTLKQVVQRNEELEENNEQLRERVHAMLAEGHTHPQFTSQGAWASEVGSSPRG